jgi:hypothetical protein
MSIWADYSPAFTPGGSAEYEDAAWERRENRIAYGWPEEEADQAYQTEMSAEGCATEKEAEIG